MEQRSEMNLAKVAEAALRLQASPDSRDSLVPAEKQAVGGNDVTQEDMVLQEHTRPKQSITRALKLTTILNEAAYFRMAIPPEHAVDRSLKLSIIRLIDATGIDPEISQPVSSRLFGTEPDLVVAGLPLPVIPCLR